MNGMGIDSFGFFIPLGLAILGVTIIIESRHGTVGKMVTVQPPTWVTIAMGIVLYVGWVFIVLAAASIVGHL